MKIEGSLFLSPFPSFLFLNNSVLKPLGRRGGDGVPRAGWSEPQPGGRGLTLEFGLMPKKGEEGIPVTSGQGGEELCNGGAWQTPT